MQPEPPGSWPFRRTSASGQLSDIPTVAESGVPGYDVGTWTAIVAPAKMPPEIVRKLQGAFHEALHDPKHEKFLQDTGRYNVPISTTEEMQAFFKSEVAKWTAALQKANLVGLQ